MGTFFQHRTKCVKLSNILNTFCSFDSIFNATLYTTKGYDLPKNDKYVADSDGEKQTSGVKLLRPKTCSCRAMQCEEFLRKMQPKIYMILGCNGLPRGWNELRVRLQREDFLKSPHSMHTLVHPPPPPPESSNLTMCYSPYSEADSYEWTSFVPWADSPLSLETTEACPILDSPSMNKIWFILPFSIN